MEKMSLKHSLLRKNIFEANSAEKLKTALLAEIDKGAFVKPSKRTVQDNFTQWLNGYIEPNLFPTTAETCSFITTKHILPHLGNIVLMSTRHQTVQDLYSEVVKSGFSSATVQKIHNIQIFTVGI
jgi:hypothetical protein